jgi:hypothetical protein
MKMELDELKSAWNEVKAPVTANEDILLMLKENRHPVLKGIKKQFAIELISWAIFLTCYYSMFDGAERPVVINVILVIATLIPIIHNLYGYSLAKHVIKGPNLKSSLESYLYRMKVYARTSIITRVLFISGLLIFFTYKVSFTSMNYYWLAAILLTVAIQVVLLRKIWMKRLNILKEVMEDFT